MRLESQSDYILHLAIVTNDNRVASLRKSMIFFPRNISYVRHFHAFRWISLRWILHSMDIPTSFTRWICLHVLLFSRRYIFLISRRRFSFELVFIRILPVGSLASFTYFARSYIPLVGYQHRCTGLTPEIMFTFDKRNCTSGEETDRIPRELNGNVEIVAATGLSQVPQVCKNEPCQLGVDEAGRGPVLGPMVYGISYAPLLRKQLLVELGCADSKSLTETKRDEIFDDICQHKDSIGWAIEAISPNVIANGMYRRTKISLNEISMTSATDLIRAAIEAGVNVAEVYVDTVGKPETYQARLQAVFPGVKIVVAKKADSTYPIVSAASICAKVSRDHAIHAWRFRENETDINGRKYGSGYPNDPVTKSWLSTNVDTVFGFPQLVRFSWSTAEQVLQSKALAVEWEETEESDSPNEQKILHFFARSPSKTLSSVHVKKHRFFTERCLSNATVL